MEKPSLSVAVLLLFFGLSLGVFPFLSMAALKREWPSLKESQERMLDGVKKAKAANNHYFVFKNHLMSRTYYEIRLQATDDSPKRGYVESRREQCTDFQLKGEGQKDLFSISVAAYARLGNQFHPVAIQLQNVPPGSTCELVDFASAGDYLLAGMTCRNGDAELKKRFFPGVLDSLKEAGKLRFEDPNNVFVSQVQAAKSRFFQSLDVVGSLMQSGIIPFQPAELAKRNKIYATITNKLREVVKVSVTSTRLVLDHPLGSEKPRAKLQSTVILAGVIEKGKGPQEVDLENTPIAFKLEEPYTITMEAEGTVPFRHSIAVRRIGKTDGGYGVPYVNYTVKYMNPNKEADGVAVDEQAGGHI